MKGPIILITVLLCCFTTLCAQNAKSKQSAENVILKIQQYQQELFKLDAKSIYDQIEQLSDIIAIKGKETFPPDLEDEDVLKRLAYVQALEAKRKLNEPVASFFWARYNSRICRALDSIPGQGNMAARCWTDTLESFKIASESGIAQASFDIGTMYEKGWGVTKSNYLSAEWFIKAANKHISDGEREGALVSIEAALNVVPDHPAALRLKAQLLK